MKKAVTKKRAGRKDKETPGKTAIVTYRRRPIHSARQLIHYLIIGRYRLEYRDGRIEAMIPCFRPPRGSSNHSEKKQEGAKS